MIYGRFGGPDFEGGEGIASYRVRCRHRDADDALHELPLTEPSLSLSRLLVRMMQPQDKGVIVVVTYGFPYVSSRCIPVAQQIVDDVRTCQLAPAPPMLAIVSSPAQLVADPPIASRVHHNSGKVSLPVLLDLRNLRTCESLSLSLTVLLSPLTTGSSRSVTRNGVKRLHQIWRYSFLFCGFLLFLSNIID